MTDRVIYTKAAAVGLDAAAGWLTQPGSGFRAHNKLDDLHASIERLPEDYDLYAKDPDVPNCRLAVIHGYAVRYRRRKDGAVVVLRVFGPGQRR
jgi:plasmid stabilization system protein ParE